jgi:hemolysin activation/secretion protein
MKNFNAPRPNHIHKVSRAFLPVFVIAAAAFSMPAHAQVENQTGIADPGRAAERLRDQLTIPQAAPNVEVKNLQLQKAPSGADKIKFKFGGLRIEGDSVYTETQLAPMYQSMIGQQVSLADIYDLANKITAKYRNDGYILTQAVVPPQTIESGIARLQVVEGFVDRVVVQPGAGEGEHAIKTIKDFAGMISKSKPLNIRQLERQLLIINDLPGVRARSILSPSRTVPGAADLTIITERKQYDALASVDNYGSRYLGPIQFGGAATLNSILGLNEAITGQVVMAHDSDSKELGYASLQYEMPVGPYGTRVSLLGSTTHTTPGYDLEEFDVVGRSNLLSLKATHPFIRTRAETLTGRALFDWKNVSSQNNLEDTRHDRLRVARIGAEYQFLDRLFGAGANAADFEVSRGLDIMGSSDEGDLNMTRSEANPQATKANLDVQRLQRIIDNINLLIEGRGQIASDPLLSSEEFSIGGFSSGRGYDPSEITGDDGISGRLEAQFTNPFPFKSVYYDKYQLFAAYDIGKVWNQDATNSADKIDSLASVSLGVKFDFVNDYEGGLAVAFPVTKSVEAWGPDHDPRFYFNLNKRF